MWAGRSPKSRGSVLVMGQVGCDPSRGVGALNGRKSMHRLPTRIVALMIGTLLVVLMAVSGSMMTVRMPD